MLKKLFKETLIYGLSRYIGKFIGIFLLPLYTSMLTPEDYGILDLLGTVSVVSGFLVISGSDAALGYYYYRKEFMPERKIMISSALWIRLILSFIIFLLIVILSGFFSEILFNRDYTLFFYVTGLTVAFSSVYSFFFDLVRFEFRPWFYTIISTSGILIQITLNIYYILYLKEGVYGALIANAISYLLFFLVSVIYVFKNYGFGLSSRWFKDILSYGAPLIGTGIAVWILNSTDRYFIAHYEDLTDVGIYAVGMKVASFLGLIAGAIQLAWSPFAMDIQYHENAKNVYSKVFLIYFILNITGIFLISIFAQDILKVFTQPGYYSAKIVIPFLCLSIVLWSGYFIVATGIAITKKAQHTVWITILAAIVNIILNFLLTTKLGSIGAAFSIMFANFLIFVLTLYMSQKLYFVNYPYSKVIMIFIPAVCIIVLSYLFNFNLIIRIIFALLYIISMIFYLYHSYKNSPELKRILSKINFSRTKDIPEINSPENQY